MHFNFILVYHHDNNFFIYKIFKGRWFSLIPFNVPIHVVVGEPIEIKQNPFPTNEEIETILKIYKSQLIDLFEKNKHNMGYGDKKLIII